MLLEEIERLRKEVERSRSAPPDDDEPPRREEPPSTFGEDAPPGWFRRTRAWLSGPWEVHELRSLPRRPAAKIVLGLAILAGLVFAGLALGAVLAAPALDAKGPPANALLGPRELGGLTFSVRGASARWQLDALDVSSRARVADGRSVFPAGTLGDGEHRLAVTVDGGFPGASSTHRWRFTIDTTPPAIALPSVVEIETGKPIRLAGRLERGASLTLNGRHVNVERGRFSIGFRTQPASPVTLVARDRLGNTNRKAIAIEIVPRQPPEPVRAVHVTIDAWATPSLRNPVLRMVEQGRIDAIELDLKDESGRIGFDAPIPLGHRIGSIKPAYNLAHVVAELHSKHVRVIGRIVAFRDPVLAAAAWKAGERSEVIQTPNREPYSGYGGFTNFADPVVRKYNVDIAVAAAKDGIDEVLYDYVRRPDGPLSTMVFPGLRGSAEASVASFLGEAQAALKPYATYLGASVFGVAATRPDEVAQSIPMIAKHVDYVAPMVYPSHWNHGEYGVPNPNAEPYEIVLRSLRDFQADVHGTGARVVPWLQDFSLGYTYGPAQVRAQIDAARADGIDEWILWDPGVTYSVAALDPGSARRRTTSPEPAVRANELGLVPVLMHHEIRAHPGPYDSSPAQFRAELERLWRDGYVPITAGDLASGKINVPAGRSPVVLTFDDSDNNQIAFRQDGSLDPKSGVGILIDFAKKHPGFTPTATFFVLRAPFTGDGRPSSYTLRWLAAHGFELGDHTHDHIPLRTLSDVDVQKELVEGQRLIERAVPGAKVVSMALPLGSYPRNAKLALDGHWDGEAYHFGAVFLSGAEPSVSPFSSKFDPSEIRRIAVFHDKRTRFADAYWLNQLEQHPEERYISDGDPTKISFPAAEVDGLAAKFSAEANAY